MAQDTKGVQGLVSGFGLPSSTARVFDHGEVRYVIIALIAKKPSYGYEIIKAIEERLLGAYSPSPGLVYPTLNLLWEMGYATAEIGIGGKRRFSLTDAGRKFHEDSRSVIQGIFDRMDKAAALHGRVDSPPIVRAIQNLKTCLKLKSGANALTDAQVHAIADAIDEASRKIEVC